MQLLTLITAACADPIVRTLPASVDTIHLDIPRSELVIRYDDAALRTTLTVLTHTWWPGCALMLTGDHDAVSARIVHDSGLAGLACHSPVTLVLAGDSVLQVHLAAGDITTAATPGHQELHVGTGQVHGVMSEGIIRVAQGRVDLSHLHAPLDVHIQVGHIQLTYDTPPSGAITARADMGSVTVTLPAASPVSPQVYTSIGKQEQQFPAGDGAMVWVESRLGHARLLAAQGERSGHDDPGAPQRPSGRQDAP
ncbi:MAG: hypothetical protein P8R54_01915 [Myxococcota bacterium]|nr:hypothetical protein [Myxococcota bacterium]